MASQKQIEANRRNARKSTGAWTEEGKAIVAANALTHGLCSERIIAPGEDADEFEQFAAAMMAQLAPASPLERVFAERVVQAAWRLGRATRLEKEVLTDDYQRQRQFSSGGAYTLGKSLSDWLAQTDKYGRLCRYESHVERAMYKALHELQRLQAIRAGKDVSAPVAVDVNVSGMKDD